jgi:hypothetical protein
MLDLLRTLESFPNHALKLIFAHRITTDAQNAHTLETSLTQQPAQRGHELAFREIASGAKDHDYTRLRVRESRLLKLNWSWFYDYC